MVCGCEVEVTRERNFFNFTKSLRRGSPRSHGRNWKNRELWPSVSWMTINKRGMPLLLSGGKKSWSILTHRCAWVGGCSDLCHPSDLYRDDVEMLDIVPERKKSNYLQSQFWNWSILKQFEPHVFYPQVMAWFEIICTLPALALNNTPGDFDRTRTFGRCKLHEPQLEKLGFHESEMT